MTETNQTSDRARQPKGLPVGGQWATSEKSEANSVTLGTPVHDVSTLRPDVVTHIDLGPDREWGTICGQGGCDEHVYGDSIGAVNSAKSRHRFTDHRGYGDEVALKVGEWVTSEKDGVRISFTDLGEGMNGEYDESDPDDAAMLRVDVQVRAEHPDADGYDEAEYGWHWPEGTTSLCTFVERDNTTPEQMRRLLDTACGRLANATRGLVPLSSVISGFESMSIRDVDRHENDSPTETERRAMIAERTGAEGVDFCEDCGAFTAHHRGHAPYSGALSCMTCDENGPRDDSHLDRGTDGGAYVIEHGVDMTPGQVPSAGHL